MHHAGMKRSLYLVAYDVSAPSRLRRALSAVKPHRASGQKSVAECFLHGGERDRLCVRLANILDTRADRLLVLRLDPRMPTRLYGTAIQYRGTPFIVS